MPNKMLIDASHPEETRVVVVRGSRIEEFDFESQDKKQLRGNIYLARVTRVEPSLQAAFVEYGGNRHGFLAFSEIHPDYYQIPVADRQALLKADAEQARAEEDDDEEDERRSRRRRRGHDRKESRAAAKDDAEAQSGDTVVEEFEATETEAAPAASESAESEAVSETVAVAQEGDTPSSDDQSSDNDGGKSMAMAVEADVVSEPAPDTTGDEGQSHGRVEEIRSSSADEGEVESVGAEDALEEVHARRKPLRRQYKIQEVIKRRQILLVQVVKEERGNKGAALTTYLSLAGRYSVLMPNTARGGGISRKITSAQDRKRLKEVVRDLDVPDGMGVILRTAGENRTKAEIKRDYEYLMRLWENVRNLTLQSTAPALVYEEGSLIKRSVRDLYNKDIDEILVAGEDGYREAKDFMRMLMPSHAKVVQPYRDTTPIFARNGIEAQLDRMVQPQVTLKSGGYLIINQTEALVSIDVNSGRSTKEHNIEDTALQTNLEAAEEVARQLRLRDLAGLIVIDFIDMEENRNNRSVEKRLKDHLKNDRARIQVGRISHFGLLEMSRQRIRASVLESTMKPCPHCGGTGHVRSDSSVALLVVRAIEEFLLKDSRSHLSVRTPAVTALYILNNKRTTLVEMERRFGVTITIEADETLGAQHYTILRGALAEKPAGFVEPASLPPPATEPDPDDDIVEEADDAEATERSEENEDRPNGQQRAEGEHRDRKRRRRRRRRGGRDREQEQEQEHNDSAEAGVAAAASDEETDDDTVDGDDASHAEADASEASPNGERRKRRRGKRGGKRNRQEEAEATDEGHTQADEADDGDFAAAGNADVEAAAAVEIGDGLDTQARSDEPVEVVETPPVEEAPKKQKRAPRPRKTTTKKAAAQAEAEIVAEEPATAAAAEPTVEASVAEAPAPSAEPVEAARPEEQAAAEDETRPKKGGWWQRKGFF